jgi:hypothetical protein
MPDPQAGHNTGDSPEPVKRKRTATKGQFSHHTCWHGDAWKGILGMPPAEVGVYWRIILLTYIRRSALRDDDREIAQLCHTELKTYRRIKAALIARGRIEVDEENGILFDKRAVAELVDAGFFSEEQTERAIKSHRKRGGKRVDKSDAAESVVAVNGHEVDANYASISTPSPVEIDTASVSDQALSSETEPAIYYPIPNESSSTESSTAQSEQAPPPSPLIGGGGALEAQRQGEGKPSDKRAATRARFDAGAFAQRTTSIVETESEGEGATP